MGFVVPAIHIRDNLQLKPNEYSIVLKGVEVAKGDVMPGYCLAITTDDRGIKLKGIKTKEPTFGLPAVWVAEREKDSIQARGLSLSIRPRSSRLISRKSSNRMRTSCSDARKSGPCWTISRRRTPRWSTNSFPA